MKRFMKFAALLLAVLVFALASQRIPKYGSVRRLVAPVI